MAESYYQQARFVRTFRGGQGLPVISKELDSVRVYQFEVHFQGVGNTQGTQNSEDEINLTLAAKQVSPGGLTIEAITVDRLNDKVYYPGKVTQQSLTITFDHLYVRNVAPTLWEWFKSVYNPMTGDLIQNTSPGGGNTPHFKANKLEIVLLDNTKTPHAVLEYYGVFPITFKPSELNYSTNEFHTFEVEFKYDFMDFYNTPSING